MNKTTTNPIRCASSSWEVRAIANGIMASDGCRVITVRRIGSGIIVGFGRHIASEFMWRDMLAVGMELINRISR